MVQDDDGDDDLLDYVLVAAAAMSEIAEMTFAAGETMF